jgi:hypothetical protein
MASNSSFDGVSFRPIGAQTPDGNDPGSPLSRIGEAHFLGKDGLRFGNDPNPREISNVVVGEGDAETPNAHGHSGMMYAWGQFLDHDLDLVEAHSPPINIVGPDGLVVPVQRADTDGQGHPVNSVSGWEDASMVYGSDPETANSLRLPDGTLRTSSGNNLPIVDGQFVAGDARAAENPSLTALHTLFVREHNWQVAELRKANPDWSGDDLYESARAIVTAEIANITDAEFLPHLLGGSLPSYKGYNPNIDPSITAEFAGAAFRWGHSIVSNETEKLNNDGTVSEESRPLSEVFFEPPHEFTANGGADGILRHLSADVSPEMDVRIVDGLREFLIDPPNLGTDLAVINIQRGRDIGLGTLNETREALGRAPYTDIGQITDDQGTVAAMRQVYGDDVDKVDLWTGGLAERHAGSAFIGETFKDIITRQFVALRDGDPYWFQNQHLDPATLAEIEHTQLSDIILRNTDTVGIQDDVFQFAERGLSSAALQEPDVPQNTPHPDWLT